MDGLAHEIRAEPQLSARMSNDHCPWPEPVAANISAAADRAPVISIVVCTHNRVHHLAMALHSLFDQGGTRDFYEILLVNNRSSDATAELGLALASKGLLRYVDEPMLGLCHARNTGWRAARGRYVAYFDDDALAEKGWIDAIGDAFAWSREPGCEPEVVGGRVLPLWEAERPAWLSDAIARSLTIVDWSPEPRQILDVRVEWLVGANMAISRRVLEEVGGFDPRLDRIGSNMLSGGDVHLQREIIDLGYRCLYFPPMAIRHLAPRSRLRKSWFEKRYLWQGISDAMMTLITDRPTRGQRLALAGRAVTRLLRRPRELVDLVRSSDDPLAFERRCHHLITVGYILGLLGKART